LRILFNVTFFIFATLSLSLFYGCSGHTLQDLVDGKTTSKSSSEESTQVKEEPNPVPPSQNRALNSISPSSTSNDKHNEDRYLQKSTNEWLQNEWEPLTESNTSTIKEVNSTAYDLNSSMNVESNQTRSSNDINSTGLQYYVDKAGIYLENKEKRDANKTKTPSHAEKLNTMPGIGKSHKRR